MNPSIDPGTPFPTHFEIYLDKTVYTIKGTWTVEQSDHQGTKADLNHLPLSFNHLVFIDEARNLIHPDEVGRLTSLLAATKFKDRVDLRFKIVNNDREVRWMKCTGVVELNEASSAALLKATMDCSMDMIQVFEAVRNERNEIIDFRWILNNHTSEKNFGDVIGKRLLVENPGVAKEGIFDTFIRVVETGKPDQSERHYVHEQFNGWFMQSTVKLNDGIATTTTEITKLKQTEHDLRKSKEQLQATLDSSLYVIQAFESIRDKDGKIIDFKWVFNNKQAVIQNGDVIGKSLLKHNPRVVETGLFEKFIQVTGDGITIHDEQYHDDGQLRGWFHATLTRMGDGVVVSTENITDRKQAELALKEQAHFIEGITEAIPDLIGIIEIPSRKLLYFNHQPFAMTGYTTEEVAEMTSDERMRILVHPDHRETVNDFYSQLEHLQPGEVTEVEYRSQKKHAGEFWVQLRGTPYKLTDSKVVQAVCVARDITNEKNIALEIIRLKDEVAKQATDKYFSLFNSLDEGFCLLEPVYDSEGNSVDMRLIDVNPAYEKQTGLKLEPGKTFGDYFSYLNPQRFEQYAQVVRTGEPLRFTDYSSALKKWYDFHVFRIGTPEDNQIALLLVDITERKQQEEELRQLNARLQEMDKAKTTFFNNVSHEFKTPLTLLIAPLEDIIKNSKSKIRPDEIMKLQISLRSAMRLQKLVNTLLDFARIEAGKLEAFYQPTDFAKVSLDLAANFRSAIEKAGLKFTTKAEAVNESIYLNREMWEKIVFNLLSNAFKFTQTGKVEVIIRNKKKNVELRVKDTGIGIAPQNLSRIFERFTRIEENHARTYEGTGIGLALVRELVVAMGGTIKVKSEEQVGSEFIVSIPKGKAHLSPRQIFENKEKLATGSANESYVEEAMGWLADDERLARRKLTRYLKHDGLRVLIVEDNADMREYLASVLDDEYHTLSLEHGKKVLDFLNDGGQADLIVADVMMPELNGYEMVRQLKSNPKLKSIPVILLSSNSTEEAKIEGYNAGADDYLPKPFSATELKALVKVRIDRSRGKQTV